MIGVPSDEVRSVARACEILTAVGAATQGLTMTEIAAAMGLNYATCTHQVRTLASRGYLLRWDDGGRWRLGPAVAARAVELERQMAAAPNGGRGETAVTGVAPAPVRRYLKLTPEAAAALVDRYKQGADLRAVADEFEVSYGTAQRTVSQAGALRRPGGDPRRRIRPDAGGGPR